MFRNGLALTLFCALPIPIFAQPGGILPRPTAGPIIQTTPYPFLPTPAARQSALPVTVPAVSPILRQPQQLGGFGGGYLWYPAYWYTDRPVVQVNYNIQILPVPQQPLTGPAARARLSLDIPAVAEVWLQGKRLDPFVGKRVFESPDLFPGETHTFSLRILWPGSSEPIEEKQDIQLRAGEHRGILYLAPPTKSKP